MGKGRAALTTRGNVPRGPQSRVARLAMVAVPLCFFAIFFAYPVATILDRGLGRRGRHNIADLFTDGQLRSVLWFTLWQAVVSTLLTLAVGLPAARALARYRFTGKAIVRALVVVPFALPTVVIGGAINALIDRFGLDDGPVRLYHTTWAILLAHVIFNVAVIVRVVGGYWALLDDRVDESAQMLGASRWRVFVEIDLPRLRPAITAACAIVFLFCFTSFGVILLLGGPRQATIESEIWRYAVQRTDFHTAALLSAFQLGAVIAMVAAATLLERRIGRLTGHGRVAAPRRLSTSRERARAAASLAPTVVLVALPLASLVERSLVVRGGHGFDNYRALGSRQRASSTLLVPPIEAVRNSLLTATVATLIGLVVGGLAAGAIVYGRRAVARVLDIGLMLPLGTSAVTLGFGFLIALDEPPLDLRTSWILIPLAQALVAIPFVVRIVVPALRSIDDRLRDAATVLGASPQRVWRHVDWPVAARAASAAAAFAFAISLGEFGATSFLARPDAPTIPIAMFRLLSQPGAALRGMAMALAVILGALVMLATLVVERFRPRSSVSL
ncbi:MAG: iron ABC transporter permease [Acidimicrobiales bacterium]